MGLTVVVCWLDVDLDQTIPRLELLKLKLRYSSRAHNLPYEPNKNGLRNHSKAAPIFPLA